ncbi:hypothetical protein N181_23170 [Sinorhizobium fredii USDA 205]|uniref:Uncharacterized protein n=1 Tax=Rhizobium fredii TaxID=380 RepID=A0A844A144_RHIFR|nr:hypothetical protein [Sinorhizobium fredii]KSV85563.1 hypothetical protein N181_23170 [Sinorhizobium fredii USDA 205]MQX06799.1 hypothetical protein [Sinorhizobium fredii]GEC34022.1 hypothetical protein EFR01_41930 [Sinorhizobium fredii]GLS06434.1 hypothetical protein GCM10007864_00580 [Sinorhizobium fredii]
MSEITVANGWKDILAETVEEASKLPAEWCFEITQAETIDGALKLSATYNSFDIPLDDYLPPHRKLPHPFRSEMRIRETAREKSLQTCECCGRPGNLIDAGESARVRCVQHGYVVDAVEWSGNPVGAMFETAEEEMAHFLKDYGNGLEMMQELAGKDDDDTRH